MASDPQLGAATREPGAAAPPVRATTRQLQLLARHFTAEFDAIARAFARAQVESDSFTPLDLAIQRLPATLSRAEAALRTARDGKFLRRFLSAAIQEGLAGDAASRSGQALIAAASTLYPHDLGFYGELSKKVATLAPAAGGPVYDAGMMLNKFVQVPRFICRIETATMSPLGSGVLVAPHLVATAAHVLRDAQTGQLRSDIAALKVRFDVIRQGARIEPRPIAVTGMAWSDLAAGVPLVPDDKGVFGLAELPDPIDDDDIAILTLAETPGHFRGWIDISAAGPPAAWPTSVICFSLPLGGYQQFSTGMATKLLGGRRIEHSCKAHGGSSGGALIDNRARLVGVHHGQIPALDPEAFLGGGGTALANWWRNNPTLRDPPPDPTALWEIRKSLPSGEGQPVLGFGPVIGALLKIQNAAGDRFSLSLQADHSVADPAPAGPAGPRAFAAICSPLQSAVLGEVMAEILPAKLATIIDLRRANLQDVFVRAADAAIDPRGGDGDGGGAVTAAVEGLARLVMAKTAAAGTVDDSVFKLSTDLVWARAAAAMLARCYAALPGTGLVWTVVQISNRPVRPEMSEALGHLYRAAVSVPGGRGRLVVAGSDPGIYDALAALLRGTEDAPGKIEFPPLLASDVEAWLDRWSAVVGAVQPERAAVAANLRVTAALELKNKTLERRIWEIEGRTGMAVPEVHDAIIMALSTALTLRWLKDPTLALPEADPR